MISKIDSCASQPPIPLLLSGRRTKQRRCGIYSRSNAGIINRDGSTFWIKRRGRSRSDWLSWSRSVVQSDCTGKHCHSTEKHHQHPDGPAQQPAARGVCTRSCFSSVRGGTVSWAYMRASVKRRRIIAGKLLVPIYFPISVWETRSNSRSEKRSRVSDSKR